MTRFYLGTHMPAWLYNDRFAGVPLFVSHHQLRKRVTPFPRAVTSYAVDSGAFTELARHGEWRQTPEEYVAALRRYWRELGPFDFAGQQDYLCAEEARRHIEAATGAAPSVVELQARTVANFVELRALAPELPIAPSIQGDTHEEYLHCVDRYADAGVDLAAEPIVAVGSLVGRSPAFVERLLTALADRGITATHAFGVKGGQLDVAGHLAGSVDSTAWSFQGRRNPLPDCEHAAAACQNCPRFALRWRERTLARLAAASPQLGLAI